MKSVFIFLTTTFISFSVTAQIEKKEIIIQKNGTDQKTINVQVDGDKVLINGMTPEEFRSQSGPDNVIISGDMFGNALGSDDEKNINQETIDSIAFLGVSTKQNEKGAEVINVSPESAAEKAGIIENDVIIKLGNDKIISPNSLSEAVRSHKPDEKVEITFLRNGKEKTCSAVLQLKKEVKRKVIMMKKSDGLKLPGNFDFGDIDFNFSPKPKLGLKIQDTENESGVKVIEVNDDSPAAKSGVKKDDIITSINGNQIKTTDEAREQLREAEDKSSYDVRLIRNGTEMNIEIKIPKKLKTADL